MDRKMPEKQGQTKSAKNIKKKQIESITRAEAMTQVCRHTDGMTQHGCVPDECLLDEKARKRK